MTTNEFIIHGTLYKNLLKILKDGYIDNNPDKKNLDYISNPKQIFTQLIYKNIPKPKLYFINNYYDKEEKQWKSNETAFIKIPNYDYLDFKSSNYSNLYNLGTHNGKHKNSFTSLESAISNSIKLSNIIYKKKEKIRRCFDVRDFIIVLLAIIILIILWKLK